MKFGKQLQAQARREWIFYALEYKQCKKCLKVSGSGDKCIISEKFFAILSETEEKLTKFYIDKETWALGYIKTLEDRVESLREVSSSAETVAPTASPSESSVSSASSEEGEENIEPEDNGSIIGTLNFEIDGGFSALTKRQSFATKQAWLKDEYRRMGASKEFKAFIYAKKSLNTFGRQLDMLLKFLDLNKMAFSKILKKYDKRVGLSTRAEKMDEILNRCPFLDCTVMSELKGRVDELLAETTAMKPQLPEGWENRKVYTIGCFDLFHAGHENVLMSLREFGCYVVAGIHDDGSYFQLKNKDTIDNIETRMANVKPYVDQIFVIPSTDPLPFIRAMVSEQDIADGSCCYARGDDMEDFPAREWVESVMPVHFVPRTEACSSTLLRAIYHGQDEETRKKAAFAKTRYDGKPIDEHGNLLKFNAPAPAVST
jgi:cytidyltransferase-like protein